MVKIINVGNNGIDQQEWKKIEAELKAGKDVQVIDGKGDLIKQLSASDLGSITKDALNAQVSQSGEPASSETVLKGQMDALVEKIAELQQQDAAKELIKAKQNELAALVKQAEAKNVSFELGSYKDTAGTGEKNPLMGETKAQVAVDQEGGQKTVYSGKAQTLSDSSFKFDSAAYAQTMATENSIMSAWDSINKNTTRGKQLMQLFFYYSKMAESGDMGAIYQFMKFITYIVSKDKAKQQIEMGKQLIKLQEQSRQWTNKLLNLSTDSSDPNASNELMKTMTIVKAETDEIATSQKLISQMMEEFSQVVETLQNTTKAALDTEGRILRSISRIG